MDNRIQSARIAIRERRWRDAEALAAAVLGERHDMVEALEVLYLAASATGAIATAEKYLRTAIEIAPKVRWPYGDLARLLLAQGRHGEARQVMQMAIMADPENPDPPFLLAGVALEQGLAFEAEGSARQAIRLAGRRQDLLVVLGSSLLQQGRLDEARASLVEAAAMQGNLEALTRLSELEEREGNFAEATRWLNQAEPIARQRGTDVDLQRATLLARQGRTGEALALLDRRQALSGAALLVRGRLRDKAGRHGEAWCDWAAGKAKVAAQSGRSYAAEEVQAEAEALRAFAFGQNFDRADKTVSTTARPVLVLGFPRSGTTLVEQILCAHSAVQPGGELPFGREMRDLVHDRCGNEAAFLEWLNAGKQMDAALVAQLRAHYFARAAQYRLDAGPGGWFTDKMPLNDLWLPLIRLSLPDAVIIRVMRHPLDVLVSMLSHDMTHGQNCGYRAEDIARHMQLIDRQMTAYARAGLTADYTLRYENLVADQRGETARLMAALGLESEPAQLEFHRAARIAPTPSYAQVQEPLNDRSIGRWKHYASELGPSIDALAPLIAQQGYGLD